MALEDNQNMDDILEENIIVHDIHETDAEILTKKKNADTEVMDAKSLEADTETMDVKTLETKKYCIIEELRSWAIECNIQHNHLDKLLAILRKDLIIDLPKSAKTFLETAKATYKIIEMEDNDAINPNGQFVYFNITEKLQKIINKEFYKDNVIRLLINVDGMPISISGTKSVWAILCKIYYHLDVYRPFIVALYYGKSKPKYLDKYLEQFIKEINLLQKHGILIGKNTYKVELLAFISDTPARAFLKCTKGHGGYNACERCTIAGKLIKVDKSSKIIYPGKGYSMRTKESFFKQEDSEHHNSISPLINIVPEIDFTKIFILDHMHLFFNGVMKKLIDIWMKGSLKNRLSRQQKIKISRRLLFFNTYMPVEFQRKPRSIFDYLKWKATEFRFFLLYCGPIVLKNILPLKLYHHFLLLHVACRILCSDELAVTHNKIAKKYLERFVLALPHLYDPKHQVINMHNLLHVADDAKNFNCSLSRISCFPFENVLGEIKRTLRTHNKPLSQLCRRLHEKDMVNKEISISYNKILKKVVQDGKIYIKRIQWNLIIIATKRGDNMVLLNNGIIMKIQSIYCDKDNDSFSNIIIEGEIWKKKILIYKYPCESKLLKTWQISLECDNVAKYHLTNVLHKLIILPLSSNLYKQNKMFVMPILHSQT